MKDLFICKNTEGCVGCVGDFYRDIYRKDDYGINSYYSIAQHLGILRGGYVIRDQLIPLKRKLPVSEETR